MALEITIPSTPIIEIKVGGGDLSEINAVLHYKKQLSNGILDLSDRQIEEEELDYVNELAQICQCHHLVLKQNYLEHTRKRFPSFITILDLSMNKLEEISLEGLWSLSELNISRNCIKTLKGVDCCPALQVLNASHNEVSFVCGYAANTRLTELDLSFNKVSTIEDLRGISVWESIQTFDVTGNPVNNIPYARLTIKHLLTNLVWFNRKKEPSSPKAKPSRFATARGNKPVSEKTPRKLGYATLHGQGSSDTLKQPVQVSVREQKYQTLSASSAINKSISNREKMGLQTALIGDKNRTSARQTRSQHGKGRSTHKRKQPQDKLRSYRNDDLNGKQKKGTKPSSKYRTKTVRISTLGPRSSSPSLDMEELLCNMIVQKRSLLSKLQRAMNT